MSIHYSLQYIQTALTSTTPIPLPDEKLAGSVADYNLLLALYESHCSYGRDAVKLAWRTLKTTARHLDRRPKYFNANQLKDIPIPRYAEGGYPFYLTALNLLVGPRGSGKSFVALDVGAKIADAHPNQPVIYTAGEGLPAYVTRWEAWRTHYKKDLKNLYFWDGALQLLDMAETHDFIEEFRDKKPSFIIIDTVARAMTGYNENDTQQMGLFIKSAEDLMRELNCGILLVHHTGRMGVQRGSSALDAGVDAVVVVSRDGSTLIVHNEFEKGGKNRFQSEMKPIALRFHSFDVTINDKLESGAVLLPTEMPHERADMNLTVVQLQIMEAIEAGKRTPSEIMTATGLGKSTLFDNLTKLKKAGVINQHPVSKSYEIDSPKGEIS